MAIAAIGPTIRRALGPLERPVASLYRMAFFNLGRFARQVQAWKPEAARVLEVGCGEGQLLEALLPLYPRSRFVGIDISPSTGRLFRGDGSRVEIRRQALEDLARQAPDPWDLVILCDVLHHVPWAEHRDLLESVARVLAPGGHLVIKEWERRPTPIHWLGYASDRWITGDRIRYLKLAELEARVAEVFGSGTVTARQRLPPWANNLALLIQAGGRRTEHQPLDAPSGGSVQ